MIWKWTDDSNRETTRIDEIVLVHEDWIIFIDQSCKQYFVRYLGIVEEIAIGNYLDANDRAKLRALFPLQEGKSIDFEDCQIVVGTAREFEIGDCAHPAHEIWYIYEDDDKYGTVVLDDLLIQPIRMNLGEKTSMDGLVGIHLGKTDFSDEEREQALRVLLGSKMDDRIVKIVDSSAHKVSLPTLRAEFEREGSPFPELLQEYEANE